MPTGRERRDALNEARSRTEQRRNAQAAPPPNFPPFRDFGLTPPPGGPRGSRGGAVDVNVVGNTKLFSELERLVNNTGGRQGQNGGAGITSGAGAAQAAKDIARDLKVAADAARDLTKITTAHIAATQKLYDQQRQAADDLVKSLSGAGGGGGSNPANPHGAPSGVPTPQGSGHGGAGGHGGGSPFSWPGGFSGINPSSQHYDPSGLLDPNQPMFGGARNSYMDYMTHLAGGGRPEDFNPAAFMAPGRRHPTTYGEMKRAVRVGVGRRINQRFGEPSMPQLNEERDAQGNVTHFNYDPRDGSPIRKLDPTHDASEIQSISHDLKNGFTGAKMASRFAGGLARSGLVGALGDAVPGIGIAMTAVDAANRTAEWATEQRAANAHYQGIEGAENNNSVGYGERMNRLGNRLYQRFTGGMTGDQADQTFDTFTNNRILGTTRQGYMAVADKNYRQYGMDPGVSAQMIVDAANHANGGLKNMAESIRTVTETANKYGISASQAQAQLMQNSETLMNQFGFTGAAAFATAGSETAATLSLGRSGAGVGFSGMNTENVERQIASANRMGYPQYQALTQTDPVAAAQAKDKFLNQRTSSYTTGGNKAKLDAAIASVGGVDAIRANPDLGRQVAIKLEQQGEDLTNLSSIYASAGVSGVSRDDPLTSGLALVNDYTGGGQLMTNGAKTSVASNAQRSVTEADKKGLNTDSRSFWQQTMDNLGDAFTRGPGSIGGDATHETGIFGDYITPENANKGAEKDSGKIDPYIDRFIDPANGISSDKNVGVKVKTKQGDKVVPLQTALKTYRDQIAKGTATIVGGDKDGQSVSQIMGGETEQGYQGADSSTQDAGAGAEDPGDWTSGHDDPKTSDSGSGGSGDVKVTVEPGPSLQNWFKFNTGNGGSTQGGAATGSPTAPGGTPTVGGGTPGG